MQEQKIRIPVVLRLVIELNPETKVYESNM